jgi:WD40 repeat protein
MRKMNVRTGEIVWTVPRENESSQYRSAISPTGEMFAIMAANVIKVFSAADGQLKREFRLARNPEMIDITFHPDNERLIAGTYGRDSGIRVWDINSGDLLHDLRGPESNVQKLTLHPDGVHLITTSTYTMCLWDIDRGVLVQKTQLPTGVWSQGVEFNPTGDLLALSYRTYSQLWNTFDLQPVVTVPNWAVASFDATGSRLVATRGNAGQMLTGGVASLGVLDILPYVITSVPVESANSRPSSMIMAVNSNSGNASTVVTVNFTSASDQVLRLCDLTGRIIHTIHGSGSLEPQQFEIDSANLPSGALFLHACDQGASTSTILYLTK